MLARDKVNLDIFRVKDHALDDPDLLPPPDEVAAEDAVDAAATCARWDSGAGS
jgi:hypothetical protein